jgi:hypothetical protein
MNANPKYWPQAIVFVWALPQIKAFHLGGDKIGKLALGMVQVSRIGWLCSSAPKLLWAPSPRNHSWGSMLCFGPVLLGEDQLHWVA